MALIKCPECNREISDIAKSCPHCGYNLFATKLSKKKSSLSKILKSRKFKTAISIVLLVFVGIMVFLTMKDNKYKSFSGKYKSSDDVIPSVIIFDEDGSGKYTAAGITYYFDYTLSKGTVCIETTYSSKWPIMTYAFDAEGTYTDNSITIGKYTFYKRK